MVSDQEMDKDDTVKLEILFTTFEQRSQIQKPLLSSKFLWSPIVQQKTDLASYI